MLQKLTLIQVKSNSNNKDSLICLFSEIFAAIAENQYGNILGNFNDIDLMLLSMYYISQWFINNKSMFVTKAILHSATIILERLYLLNKTEDELEVKIESKKPTKWIPCFISKNNIFSLSISRVAEVSCQFVSEFHEKASNIVFKAIKWFYDNNFQDMRTTVDRELSDIWQKLLEFEFQE